MASQTIVDIQNNLLNMPEDMQRFIWKSYFSQIVLEEYNKKANDYNEKLNHNCRSYNDCSYYDKISNIHCGNGWAPVNIAWCLKWHSFIFDPPRCYYRSGQKKIHKEYEFRCVL